MAAPSTGLANSDSPIISVCRREGGGRGEGGGEGGHIHHCPREGWLIWGSWCSLYSSLRVRALGSFPFIFISNVTAKAIATEPGPCVWLHSRTICSSQKKNTPLIGSQSAVQEKPPAFSPSVCPVAAQTRWEAFKEWVLHS